MEWTHLIDNQAFTSSPEFRSVETDIRAAIDAVHWPAESAIFSINPTKQGNGVKPIKDGFIRVLEREGWELETRERRIDAMHHFKDGTTLPFAVEWETGNVSSSHRAINRMALGMLQNALIGGVLVVPTRAMYVYLTDRIGNAQEVQPYYPLWKRWGKSPEFTYLGVIAVEHDSINPDVPCIKKGTDGRALA